MVNPKKQQRRRERLEKTVDNDEFFQMVVETVGEAINNHDDLILVTEPLGNAEVHLHIFTGLHGTLISPERLAELKKIIEDAKCET